MRVALVTHQFFPRFYTGVERLTLNIANQLARMGHECIVVTSAEHSSGRSRQYAFDGVWVCPVETPRANVARPWLREQEAHSSIGRVLGEERIDLVHVMHPMRMPHAFDEAKRRGIPAVAHLADFFYLCPRVTMIRKDGTLCDGPDGGVACIAACGIESAGERLAWTRRVLAEAAAVISPSRFLIDMHTAEFDTSTWRHIPWGVDYSIHATRIPAPAHGGLAIGFIGTLLPHKAPHLLVEALRLLPDKDVRLEIYGPSFHESAYEHDLRRGAADDPRIRFHGSYTHAELRSILAGLDIVAIPSVWHENLPTSGLNAIASGVPLVVSQVSGLTELVEDYSCGFGFPAGDASALARLLERLLHNPGELQRTRASILHPPSLEEEAWRIEMVYEHALTHPSRADTNPEAR